VCSYVCPEKLGKGKGGCLQIFSVDPGRPKDGLRRKKKLGGSGLG